MVYGLNKSTNNTKFQKDSSKYLPFIPPFHGLSELRLDLNSSSHLLSHGYIKAQLVYYAAQTRVYLADNTESATRGYTIFNLGLGTGITDKNGKNICSISLIANNLWDIAYYNHLSRLKYFTGSNNSFPPTGIHEMGRNIALRLNFPLNFQTK
ncbi:MAG: hypothetical protein NVS1B13_26260 [Flavisolibacter sp.]